MKIKTPDSQRIKQITESIISLPTLPSVVAKMLELVDNPRTSATSLAKFISNDQTLTARILKLANSAYYGYPREIATVNMAIVVLGFNTVKELGLSLSVFDIFKNIGQCKAFDSFKFWEHSIGCGIAARMIARDFRYYLAGEAFVAGLLHDIGKVILNQYFHHEFTQIMERVNEGEPLEVAEFETIGTSHAQIGAWLADKWNLPLIIVNAILHHHHSANVQYDREFVSIIEFANYICHRSGMGYSGRFFPLELSKNTWDTFRNAGIIHDEDEVEHIQNAFILEFDRSELFLSCIYEKR